MYTSYTQITGDESTANIARGKRDINIGNRLFNSHINNYFTRHSKTTDLEADVDTYQLPPDCVKVTGVKYLDSGGRTLPVTQIRSEYQWTMLKQSQQSSNRIIHFFVQGADEIALYPTPSDDVTNGLIIYYKPRGKSMSQADYTTGTITLTDGSVTVTGVGTAFTTNMEGRVLRDTDDSSGYDYRISAVSSGTVLLLEEPFTGISGSGKTFLIGEAPVYPEEFHYAPIDYALGKYFQLNDDSVRASYHMSGNFDRPGQFETAVLQCQSLYASSSNSMVITDDEFAYDWTRDNTFQVTETN